MVRYSDGPIVDTTYTSDGTKTQMMSTIAQTLSAAGWTLVGDNLYESALTNMGFKIRVEIAEGTGACINLRLWSDIIEAPSWTGRGAFLLPLVGRIFRIWANKYQCFHYFMDQSQTTDPCDVCFGVPWVPNFMPPISNPPIVDEDLINFTETAYDDCLKTVYETWTFGPWDQDVEVHFSGRVDDDVRINGVILDEGMFPYNSGRSLPCDGIANGQHNFDTTFTVEADTPLVIELISNFATTASITGRITINSVGSSTMHRIVRRRRLDPNVPSQYDSIGWGGGGGEPPPPPPDPQDIDPWYGWMAGNAAADTGYVRSTGFHGNYAYMGNLVSHMWIWDSVGFYDAGGGDVSRLIGHVSTASHTVHTEFSGHWHNGIVSLWEPTIAWPSGHTSAGNAAVPMRRGQLWDAMTYGAQLPGETIKNIGGKRWRNITYTYDLGGTQMPFSLLLLTN